MSYRNPKFFNYNPLAGMQAAQESFDKVFGSAADYFEEKRKNREDYVNDVDVASNKARTITSNLKNMGLDVQNVINEGIDGFMNDALRTVDDKGNLINRAYRKGELDQATTNFSNAITPFNTFFGLVPTIDYESGLHKSASSSYREYAALIEQARSGLSADAFKMDQDGSKFNFSVTIDNPEKNFDPDAPDTITIDADRLNQLIAENNPELLNQYRTRYNERFADIKGTITTKLGVDKASFTQEQEKLFNSGKDVDGKLFDANEYVRSVVNESVDLLKDTSRDGERTLVDDIYANDVDYGTDEMFRLLSDEKYLNPTNVFASIYRDLERAKDIEGLELIGDLLETNYKDGSLNKKILTKLNITKETHRKVIEDLNAFKDDVVKEYLYDEMIGEGVASHWQAGKKQPVIEKEKPTKPTQGEKDANDLVNNAIDNFNEAAIFGAKTNLTRRSLGEDAASVKPESLLGTDYDYYGIDEEQLNDAYDIFKGTDIITKDGTRRIDEVNYDKYTKQLNFKYDQKRGIKEKVDVQNEKGETVTEERFGDLPDNTQNYDLSKPLDFKKLYMDRGVEISGTKSSVQYENAYNQFEMNYAKNNLYRFILDTGTTGGDIHKPTPDSKFGDGSMHRWVSIVAEKDPAFFTAAIENAITKDPELYNKLKDQYVKFGGRTLTVKALMVELQTKNL